MSMHQYANTQNYTVSALVNMLKVYGVRHVVVSPGTRSAPIAVALKRAEVFDIHMVIDERSAAFVALGMALHEGKPVAMLCTSGSAVLNYGPALAEAFYRQVPLIAITADRPAWDIDCNRGQTIHQASALSSVTRFCADIRPDQPHREVDSLLSQAFLAATSPVFGPVQINVQLDMPLTIKAHDPNAGAKTGLRTAPVAFNLANLPQDAVVAIVIGQNPDRNGLETDHVSRFLNARPHCYALAHLGKGKIGTQIGRIERALKDLPTPDYIVTLGGDIVSARLKKWAAEQTQARHIAIDPVGNGDVFGLKPEVYQGLVCDAITPSNLPAAILPEPPYNEWSELQQAMNLLVHGFDGVLHLGNGTIIRQAQILDDTTLVRVECNRGVNGIDGNVSTAIGDAMVNGSPTMLIVGDMAAAYDVGALAIKGVPSTFKLVVIDNGGGDIFRRITTTRDLPELDELFVCTPRLPLADLARGYGFSYHECTGADADRIADFVKPADRAAILRIIINPNESIHL